MTLRTDRMLAGFFQFLDSTVGLGNVWIALSADHGVGPTADSASKHHLGGGNVDPEALARLAKTSLERRYGRVCKIEYFRSPEVYLTTSPYPRGAYFPLDAERKLAAELRSYPGVAKVFTRRELTGGLASSDPLLEMVRNSFFPERSGDIIIILRPYFRFGRNPAGATHGSPYPYDTHVPMLLWGTPFRRGSSSEPCEPRDLVPTLAIALGLPIPSSASGRALKQALKQLPSQSN